MTSTAASLLALSDRNRLLILRVLLERPASVGELTLLSGLGQSLVSHHLAVLARSGWLCAHVVGRRRVYAPRVDGTPLAALAAWIRREIPPPAGWFDAEPGPRARPGAVTIEDWLL